MGHKNLANDRANPKNCRDYWLERKTWSSCTSGPPVVDSTGRPFQMATRSPRTPQETRARWVMRVSHSLLQRMQKKKKTLKPTFHHNRNKKADFGICQTQKKKKNCGPGPPSSMPNIHSGGILARKEKKRE
jgi:hypothetical protein